MGSPVQQLDSLVHRVESILGQLMVTPAAKLESQQLEFKSWCKDERELSHEIADAAVCLASTDGGLLIVGVDDKLIGPRAMNRCPHPGLSVDWVKAKIRELTRPAVRCRVRKVSDLLPNFAGSLSGDLFVVELPKSTYVSGHRNTKGVSLKRYDKSCKPEYFEGQDDFSASSVEHLDFNALDEGSMAEGAKTRSVGGSLGTRVEHRPIDHLFEAGLIGSSVDQRQGSPEGAVTIAALLIFGKDRVIRSEFPLAETALIDETSIARPTSSSSWLNIVAAVPYFTARITELLKPEDQDIPREVLRELLVNAYVHRCYRTQAPIQIKVRPGEVEIVNPGGLLGGLTTDTLLYSPPTYRNFLLADAARQFGYCERIGSGIDRVYYFSLLAGFDFPVLQAGSNSFSALLRTNRDRAFARFVSDYAGGLNISLNEVIILRGLRGRSLLMAELCKLTQRTPEHIGPDLLSLQKRLIVDREGERYRLSKQASDIIAQYDESGQVKLFR